MGYAQSNFEGGFITTLDGYSYEAYHSPPTVVNVTPTSNNVSTASNIEIKFSSPMDKSATEGAFLISPDVSGTKEWKNSYTMVFRPNNNLPKGIRYTITIKNTAKDLSGNTLSKSSTNVLSSIVSEGTGSGSDFVWSFATEIGDTVAPSMPVNLTVTPNNWTKTNAFSVNWTNPNDPSGIIGAYYKLGSIPTSKTDGTYTTEKPPFNISTETQGEQTIYVWLKDKEGDIDQNN